MLIVDADHQYQHRSQSMKKKLLPLNKPIKKKKMTRINRSSRSRVPLTTTILVIAALLFLPKETDAVGPGAAAALKSLDGSKIPLKPRFTRQPLSFYTNVDDSDVRLMCEAISNPSPSIYWIKNGENVTSFRSIVKLDGKTDAKSHKNTSTLAFMNVWDDPKAGNVGDYQCIAFNKYGSTKSKVAKVYIKSIGKFTESPYDNSAKVGDDLEIGCKAPKGVPKPQLKWQYQVSQGSNFTDVKANSRKSIKNGNLVIHDVRTSDKGFYTCVAYNLAGEVQSLAAELRVLEPPVFKYLPTDRTAKIGTTVVFDCQATGNPDPWIEWYKNSKAIKSFPEYNVNYLVLDDKLKIDVEASTDAGVYTCKAKNTAGEADYRVHLEVEDPPRIESFSPSTDASVGDDVTVFCTLGGRPRSPVTWYGIKSSTISDRKQPFGVRTFSSASGQLRIDDVTAEDAGSYRCMIENGDEKTINITVSGQQDLFPPVIVSPLHNITAVVGESVTFECRLKPNSGSATIRWSLANDDMITFLDDAEEYGMTRILLEGGRGEKLVIPSVEMGSQGIYECQVTNGFGMSSWESTLSVFPTSMKSRVPSLTSTNVDLPQAPGIPRFQSSTPHSLTVSWIAPSLVGAAPVQHYQLSYFPVNGFKKGWTTLSKVESTTFTVSGLQPSNGCFFSVRAFNRFGSSEAVITSAPFYTQADQEIASSDSSALRMLDSITVNITDATPLRKDGRDFLQIRWAVGEDPCQVANGFILMMRKFTTSQDSNKENESNDELNRMAAVACDKRSYNLYLDASGEATSYEIQIRLYRDKMTAHAISVAIITSSGEVVTAQPLIITATKVTDDQSGNVEVAWNHPHILHVIDDYVVTCQTANFRQVVYVGARSGQTSATCTRLPADVTRVNVTVAYVTPLGAGPKVERSVSLFSHPQDPIVVEGGHDSVNFLATPTGMAIIAIGCFVLIVTIIGVSCFIRRRRNPKSRDRAGSNRRTGRFDQPPSYGQNFDLTLVDRSTMSPKTNGGGGGGDGNSYIKMNDAGGPTDGTSMYVPRGLGPPNSKTCTAGKMPPMSSYQPTRSASVENGRTNGAGGVGTGGSGGGGFSYVNDQLISVSSIGPQFSAGSAPRATTIPSVTQQTMQQHHEHLQQRHLSAGNEPQQQQAPPSPPLSQRTRISDSRSMSSGSMMHSNAGRSNSSGQRRRRSLRNNNNSATSRPATSTMHSNYSNPTNASTVALATLDTAPFLHRKRQQQQQQMSYGHVSRDQLNQPSLFSTDAHGNTAQTVELTYGSADEAEDEREEDSYGSSGEESFDMPSASQVGTSLNHEYQHVNLPPNNSSSSRSHHHHQEYLPTLDEVTGHGRRDTDPLLGRGSQSSEVMSATRHHHQQHHQRHQQQPRDQHASASSSVTSSYHHHTGDSGMSAGVASTEQSSLRSDVGPMLIANGMRRLVDDKFVGTLSPPPSAISMQSGYNSTASSCWQYQRPLPPHPQPVPPPPPPPQPAIHSKSWRGNQYNSSTDQADDVVCRDEVIDDQSNDFPEPPTLEFDEANAATPVYHSPLQSRYSDVTHHQQQQADNHHHHHRVHHAESPQKLHHQHQSQPTTGDKRLMMDPAAEVSTSDFYSDQSQ